MSRATRISATDLALKALLLVVSYFVITHLVSVSNIPNAESSRKFVDLLFIPLFGYLTLSVLEYLLYEYSELNYHTIERVFFVMSLSTSLTVAVIIDDFLALAVGVNFAMGGVFIKLFDIKARR